MIKLALFLLNRAKLSVEDRNKLITACLDRLNATPIRDIITYSKEGVMLLNGREVDMELARSLKESARGALNSKAFQIIKESVTYQAFATSATKATTDEDLLFGKAAIWVCQEQMKLLDLLAGDDEINVVEM